MDARDLTESALNELDGDLTDSLNGLSPTELAWQPSNEANSILFNFWHLIRAEDLWVNVLAQDKASVFEKAGWAEKWALPVGDTGYGYTAEKLASFPQIPIDELRAYYAEVRRVSLAYLGTLNPSDLDQPLRVERPGREGLNVGAMFAHVLCELGQHVGHIRYLRGLQRGMNK